MPLPVECEAAIAIVRGDLPRLSALHFSESPARDAFWWPLELINVIRFQNDPSYEMSNSVSSSSESITNKKSQLQSLHGIKMTDRYYEIANAKNNIIYNNKTLIFIIF